MRRRPQPHLDDAARPLPQELPVLAVGVPEERPHGRRRHVHAHPVVAAVQRERAGDDDVVAAREVRGRERVVLAIHPHNDRGTAVAAAELAVLAGAERVEGTLFGNGERTGNVDLLTLALNLFSQGIDPGITVTDIDAVANTVEYCNQIPIHPRRPYAGSLVYTAFSGSHQDAIKKGLEALSKRNDACWEVPYLPVDPHDLGRSYEAVIRVNSQSGKGGIAYLLKADHGLDLPRNLQIAFSRVVQHWTDRTGREARSADLFQLFRETYLREDRLQLVEYQTVPGPRGRHLTASLRQGAVEQTITGAGAGPVDAFVDGLQRAGIAALEILDYHEHALGAGSAAQAVAYVEARTADGRRFFGVGIDRNIVAASLRAVASAAAQEEESVGG